MNAARLGIVCLLVLSCGGSEPTQGPPPTEGGESGGAGAPTTCAAVSCLVGTRCIEGPEGAHCEDAPAAPACGGIAGRTCPGAGRCVDDPSDSCDPNHGGADCGGVCACNAEGLCIEGNRWDHSPEVCDCVPKGS